MANRWVYWMGAGALMMTLGACDATGAADGGSTASALRSGAPGRAAAFRGHAKPDPLPGQGNPLDGHKVEVCHVRGDDNAKGPILIVVDRHSVPAHLAHGDWLADGNAACQPTADEDVLQPPPADDVIEPPPAKDAIQPPPPPEDAIQPPPPGDVAPPPEADVPPSQDVPPVCPPGESCVGQN